MLNKIVLNLNLPEYHDDFHSQDESSEQNDLWQQNANDKLIGFLNKMGNEAKLYKKKHSGNSGHENKLSSYHHSIFISGARGSGKTVFLRNAEAIWKVKTKSQHNRPNLHFIDVIDPTLLNVKDSFSEVIIASVYASVDKELKKPDIKQERKESFYHALKKLCSALGESSEFDELYGIDRIQKYRSGIHIERYFHQFLIASVELLDCDALVLSIDDVDMKIDNAFGILDDIRCLLSCPLILPIVSGDDYLYRHIATMKFGGLINVKGINGDYEEGSDAEILSNAYLTKIFPNHYRIPLLPIDQLLNNLIISFKTEDESKVLSITYSEYEKKFKEIFYSFCNGQERSTDWPQPSTAREMTQLMKLIPPSLLNNYDENKDILWNNFLAWAEEKKDGVALTNAESFIKLTSMQNYDAFDLKNVISFNPTLQKGKFRWAKKEFREQQVQSFGELKAHKTNEEILNTVFSSVSKKENSFLKENNILRSLPPLEMIMEPMYVSQATARENKESSLLIDIFTYNEYYSRQLNRRNHIFFSRAFEILLWSMLAVTGNLEWQALDQEKFTDLMKDIFKRAPFYSTFSLNLTKIIDESNDENESVYDADENNNSLEQFISDIYRWSNENLAPEFKGKNMFPLLSCVFNKVFSQLKVLRGNIVLDKKNFRNEHLSDLAKRFEYMFINALASFVKEGEVVNTNVATGAKSSSVRNFQDFIRYDRTLYRNISSLLSNTGENLSPSLKVINIMRSHPLFLFDFQDAYAIGEAKVENESSTEINNFNNMNFSGIKDFYFKTSGNNTIRTREVTEWALENIDIAKQIYIKMKKDENIYNNTSIPGQISWMFNGLSYALER